MHQQGEFQKKFDQDKTALLISPECEGEVRLYPYSMSRARNKPKPGTKKPTGPKLTKAVHKIAPTRKGSLRRAQRAQIFSK